jgi:hypothetical protein
MDQITVYWRCICSAVGVKRLNMKSCVYPCDDMLDFMVKHNPNDLFWTKFQIDTSLKESPLWLGLYTDGCNSNVIYDISREKLLTRFVDFLSRQENISKEYFFKHLSKNDYLEIEEDVEGSDRHVIIQCVIVDN